MLAKKPAEPKVYLNMILWADIAIVIWPIVTAVLFREHFRSGEFDPAWFQFNVFARVIFLFIVIPIKHKVLQRNIGKAIKIRLETKNNTEND